MTDPVTPRMEAYQARAAFADALVQVTTAEGALIRTKAELATAAAAAAQHLNAVAPDVYEIAMRLENDGTFYANTIKPAILRHVSMVREPAMWGAITTAQVWRMAAEHGLALYRARYATFDWQPPTGAAELLAAYFRHVKYADDIAEA